MVVAPIAVLLLLMMMMMMKMMMIKKKKKNILPMTLVLELDLMVAAEMVMVAADSGNAGRTAAVIAAMIFSGACPVGGRLRSFDCRRQDLRAVCAAGCF